MKRFQYSILDILVATTWIAIAVGTFVIYGRASIANGVLATLWLMAWGAIGGGVLQFLPKAIHGATVGAILGFWLLVIFASRVLIV